MFRVVIKPYPILSSDKSYWEFKDIRWAAENSSYARKFGDNARPEISELAPFQVGETIFVKETFSDERFGKSLIYKAGNVIEKITHWRTASNMKQEHSRLTLRIKSVKVERLQDISEEDCWKEGCEEFADYQDKIKVCEMTKILNECIEDPRPHFAVYWNSTHKKLEEKWEANPFCFAYEYEVVR